MKRITVLGSTGSIGTNTLDVLGRHTDRFTVFALTAAKQVDLLFKQCVAFKPQWAVMTDIAAAQELKDRLQAAGLTTQVASGASALEVARQNALKLEAQVQFLEGDLLGSIPTLAPFDVIVSNPPYVPLRDQGEMHANVLNFEPHLALFVLDEDPLVFYQAIGTWGQQLLKKGGKLYLEIYENLAEELVTLLQSLGYSQVQVYPDLNGKNRMITCCWL